MRGQDRDGSLGYLVDLLDEDRTLRFEIAHDVEVVDDLLTHVDRRAVLRERSLDGLDRAFDAGAVAARGGEEDPLRRLAAVLGLARGNLTSGHPSIARTGHHH